MRPRMGGSPSNRTDNLPSIANTSNTVPLSPTFKGLGLNPACSDRLVTRSPGVKALVEGTEGTEGTEASLRTSWASPNEIQKAKENRAVLETAAVRTMFGGLLLRTYGG